MSRDVIFSNGVVDYDIFMNQPKFVRDVFIKWWKPKKYDLFYYELYCLDREKDVYNGINEEEYHIDRGVSFVDKDDFKDNIFIPIEAFDLCVPLLSLGQLIEFIQDKTNGEINIISSKDDSQVIVNTGERVFDRTGSCLLDIVWKVACDIAAMYSCE